MRTSATKRTFSARLYAGLLGLALVSSVVSAVASALPAATTATNAERVASEEPAPLAELVRAIHIPYQSFTLQNGLRVFVHSDHRAKMVTLTVDYNVGSTSEPAGRTGFAHLFEHLMFNGSENAPGDYALPLQRLGAELNGVTMPDRTSYYESLPTPGLEQALFLESDRMGYLLGALTQTKLDEQRGVVQNEKRQADSKPLAIVRYRVRERLYPPGHPAAHEVFGSMADLDAATLDDVKAWFRAHYGPNNAVLSMDGDIDIDTAKRLVEKYFGAIPAGPSNLPPVAPVPTLPRRLEDTLTDRVSTPHLYRAWAVPGEADPVAASLKVAVATMAQMGSSYLKQRLVQQEKSFSALAVTLDTSVHSGIVMIDGSVAAGVDPVLASRQLDAAIASMLTTPVSADDIDLYVTRQLAQQLAALQTPSSKLAVVNEGLRLGKGPDFYKTELQTLAAQTPERVQAAAATWLSRPAYALTVLPGAPAAFAAAAVPSARSVAAPVDPVVVGTRGGLPPVGVFGTIAFPQAQPLRLSNGIEVMYLRSGDVPFTQITIDVDAGVVADPLQRPGTHAMVLGLLDKGTTKRNADALAIQRDRLGASTSLESDPDRTTAKLSVPSANLQPALTLLADMLRFPAFDPNRIQEQRDEMIAGIAAADTDGSMQVGPILLQLIDADSPYTRHQGPQDADAVNAISREDLIAFHHAWFRPDKTSIFVSSDLPAEVVQQLLERSFGDWRSQGAPGRKDLPGPAKAASPRIVLIDNPDSDQSMILAGQAVETRNRGRVSDATLANIALGASFSSRLNTELRETKGWSYGVDGRFDTLKMATRYLVNAPVQQDKTGETIATIRREMSEFLGKRPMTREEFDFVIEGQIRKLSVAYGDAQSYLDAIRENRLLGRADAYQASLVERYRRLDRETAQAALQQSIDPDRFVWVVLGDAAKVEPQLAQLGLPVTVIPAAAATAP